MKITHQKITTAVKIVTKHSVMNENKATIAYYIFKNQHKIEKRRKHLKEEEEEGGKEDREEEDKMK